jgi:hypothetical protein
VTKRCKDQNPHWRSGWRGSRRELSKRTLRDADTSTEKNTMKVSCRGRNSVQINCQLAGSPPASSRAGAREDAGGCQPSRSRFSQCFSPDGYTSKHYSLIVSMSRGAPRLDALLKPPTGNPRRAKSKPCKRLRASTTAMRLASARWPTSSQSSSAWVRAWRMSQRGAWCMSWTTNMTSTAVLCERIRPAQGPGCS